jgi:hypothetical protein
MVYCRRCKEHKPPSDFAKGSMGRPYYAYCKECAKARNREKRYGLTDGQYQQMVETSSGCCAICSGRTHGISTKLHIDHNHETGQVRGLLCVKCNTAIGHFGERREVIEGALRYLDFWNNRDES